MNRVAGIQTGGSGLVQVLLADANREPLIAALRERLPSDEVAWWSSPVSGFGRFA